MPVSRSAAKSDARTVSHQLRKAIEGRGDLTAYQLGKDSGVDPGVISRFLSGQRGLTLAVADRLALALDLRLTPTPKRPRKPAPGASADPGGDGELAG